MYRYPNMAEVAGSTDVRSLIEPAGARAVYRPGVTAWLGEVPEMTSDGKRRVSFGNFVGPRARLCQSAGHFLLPSFVDGFAEVLQTSSGQLHGHVWGGTAPFDSRQEVVLDYQFPLAGLPPAGYIDVAAEGIFRYLCERDLHKVG